MKAQGVPAVMLPSAEHPRGRLSLTILVALLYMPGTSAIGNNAGKWGPVQPLPIVPVAGAVLPNHQLILWASWLADSFGGSKGSTKTAVVDLRTMMVTAVTVSNTDHDMFCPGTTLLADGRLFVNGGANAPQTSIYNSGTKLWFKASRMIQPRGYNANTLLSDGRVFTLGGSWSGGPNPKNGEVWSPTTQKWTALPGIKASSILTQDPRGVYRADNHGWFFALGDGIVFHAGPSKNMHFFDTFGSGSSRDAGTRANDLDAMNGNSVMYAPRRILALGGSTAYVGVPARNSVHLITLSGSTVKSVEELSPMAFPRAVCNSVVLPSGEVVVFGGQRVTEIFTDTNSILVPELWSPVTRTWRQLAPMKVPRNYHSIALLLPNGRVLTGGGGLCNKPSCPTGTKNHLDYEIFTPPYLLNSDGTPAARPSILNAPTTALPVSQIIITTKQPCVAFSIVRLGAATHSVNNDQRRVPLRWAVAGQNVYKLSIPPQSSGTLPGYWLLFATDKFGVPSVGRYLHIRMPAQPSASAVDVVDYPSPPPVNTSGLPEGITREEYQQD